MHYSDCPNANGYCVQIYQEVIHDLLNPHGKDMKVRQHPQFGVYVCLHANKITYVQLYAI